MVLPSTTLSSSAVCFRLRPLRFVEISFLVFLLMVMGLPLLFLLTGSFNLAAPGKPAVYGADNWLRAFTDAGTLSALWMSFLLSLVRLVPAIALSVLFAWLIARTDMPGGKFIEAICWVAYFVPDFPLVLAWILLLDPNFGALNSIAKSLHLVDGALFNPYTFWGIVWVHTSTGGVWFKVMLLVPMRRYGFFNIPSPFTLTHWHHMLTDPIFLVALKNSLIIASAAAIGGILLYFALAYLLVSRRTVTAPHEAPS
ncbi:MAG: hypothetical protein DMG15_17640 [Acidobacteria bacterium]|nr:MAG: hypothetical protein DMG15_17640 [Acidobacteriota bacterium]